MPKIHPTAIVSASAELAADVEVGPYAIIDGPVRIGSGTVVLANAHVQGRTTVGAGCKLGPAAYVGLPPQHLKADPDAGSLVIGDHVTVRETATVHRAATAGDDHATRVGDRSLIMGGSHVAHDCVLDPDVILSQGVLLGGHVTVGSRAFLGGGSVVHQFVRIGRLAIVSGNEALSQDVPPFAAARYGGLKGYNAVGCRRAGMSAATIRSIRSAFSRLHNYRLVATAINEIRHAGLTGVPEVAELLAFLTSTHRGIVPSLRGVRHSANEDHEPTSIRLTPGDVHGQSDVVPTNGRGLDEPARR
jgi:UDP-N-acetylglucosamine acyltransferase